MVSGSKTHLLVRASGSFPKYNGHNKLNAPNRQPEPAKCYAFWPKK